MLDLVLQSPGTLHGKDPTDDHRSHGLGPESDDGITLERDHVRENEVDQGKGNTDITVDHLDVNNIFIW